MSFLHRSSKAEKAGRAQDQGPTPEQLYFSKHMGYLDSPKTAEEDRDMDEITPNWAPAQNTPVTEMPMISDGTKVADIAATELAKPTRPEPPRPIQGSTRVADGVLTKLVEMIARRHALLYPREEGSLGGPMKQSGGDFSPSSVSVEGDERGLTVNLTIAVEYGVSILQLVDELRADIANELMAMTGVTVREVNVEIADAYFPEAFPRLQPSGASRVEPVSDSLVAFIGADRERIHCAS